MLHSGSRGIGNQTAQHHDRIASQKGYADKEGLNYMRIDSQEGQDYLQVSFFKLAISLIVQSHLFWQMAYPEGLKTSCCL